jgi:hypothetical protein
MWNSDQGWTETVDQTQTEIPLILSITTLPISAKRVRLSCIIHNAYGDPISKYTTTSSKPMKQLIILWNKREL